MEEKRKRKRGERQALEKLKEDLRSAEKSPATMEKYLRDAERFLGYAKHREAKECCITQETIISYKQHLKSEGYSPSSINGMLAGVRALLKSMGMDDIKVRNLRIQQQSFASEEKMLTRSEYLRMVQTGKTDNSSQNGYLQTTSLIMETICSTGIRVSELKYFTVEAVKEDSISVWLKGKERKILITGKLKKKLLEFAEKMDVREGAIFRNRHGKPIHRSQIWQMMKRLCRLAGVDERKVFPHNLRKLFARAFYNVKKDIAKLADVLGHSSINTTRRYIKTSAREHMQQMDRLRLVT